MSLKDAALTGLATSVAVPSVFVGTCVGTLFAPHNLAATARIIGATALGLKLAFLPTVFFSSMAALSSNPVTRIGFSILAAASFLSGVALGGTLFGLSAGTLLPAIGLGIAIAALGAIAIIGLTKLCLKAVLEETNNSFTPAPAP
ncbi:MAG: hypothetical protein P1U32_08315 [Legionellaceae bacterium]|nr:hypothetical protein [Legionellaceae bacterium]